MRNFFWRYASLFILWGALFVFVIIPYWATSSFTDYFLRTSGVTYKGTSILIEEGWLVVISLLFVMTVASTLPFLVLGVVQNMREKSRSKR